MPDNVKTSFQLAYKNNIDVLAKTEVSTCKPAVTVRDGLVGSKVALIDYFGGDIPKVLRRRHESTPMMKVDQERRWVRGEPFVWSSKIDDLFDQTQTEIDLAYGYAKAALYEMNKAQDHLIMRGMGEVNIVNKDDESHRDRNFDPEMIIPLKYGKATTSVSETDLNFDKLNDVDALLKERGAKNINLLMSSKDYTKLRCDPRFTSSDFMYDGKLENGSIAKILGMNIYISEAVPGGYMQEKDEYDKTYWTEEKMAGTKDIKLSAGVKRVVYAFDKKAVVLAIWRDIVTEVTKRADQCYNWQLFMSMYMGCTRIDERLVAKILVG